MVCPSFLGNLLFRISKMESCLDVDTLGVLVLFKCVIRSGARQGATEPGTTRASPAVGDGDSMT